jgi:hypothetical protein
MRGKQLNPVIKSENTIIYTVVNVFNIYITFAENVAHNVCSEIRADDKTATYTLTAGKSVTCTFRTGKSVVLMDHL